MIEDAVMDMLNSVLEWLFDKLMYLARVLLFWLPPDFTSLNEDFLSSGQMLGLGFKTLVFASYAIIIVVGGILVMSHETLQTRYSLREIVPRLVMGMLLAGVVWTILYKAFDINNDVVAALVSVDIQEDYNGAICTDPDWNRRTDHLADCDWQQGAPYSQFAFWLLFSPEKDQEIGLIHIVVTVISIFCLLVLLITGVMRNIALFFVAALAPLGLACHGLPVTEQFAHLWWRMLGACMASSIGQAALIWMYHEVRDELPRDDGVQGYWSLTRMIYLVILVWLIWKVHQEAFRIARGRPVRVPGSRLLGAFVMSRVLDRGRGSKKRITTPGTIWGTDMRRPPWRRAKPASNDEPARAPESGRADADGNGPTGPNRGGPNRGPADPGGGSGNGGGSGEAPVNPHDRRSVDGTAAEPQPASGIRQETPSWRRPLPEVADGGFDPNVATESLHGRPHVNNPAASADAADTSPGDSARPAPSVSDNLPHTDPGATHPPASAAPNPTAPKPGTPAGPPDPQSFASWEDYKAQCPEGGAMCRSCGGQCEFAKHWRRFHSRTERQ